MSNKPKNNLDECSPSYCNGFGTCRIGSRGESIEYYECLCDLWHTGQQCEHYVPIPLTITIVSTFFAALILFFCWYSSQRFSKKKIHIPKNRYRFVDYLDDYQKSEKEWLRKVLESSATGKVRMVPLEDQMEYEMEQKSNKETTKEKEKEKEKEEKPKEKSLMKPADAGKEVEKAKEFLKLHEETKGDKTTTQTTQDEEEAKQLASTKSDKIDFLELKLAQSKTSNTLPADVPDDVRKAEKKRQELEKKQQEEAEKKEKELNKKKK